MTRQFDTHLSTGIKGLDDILKGLIPGDNLVWQVGTVADYKRFVSPYVQFAKETGKDLIYFRFAGHEPLVTDGDGVRIYNLEPEKGFEIFINEIHRVIKEHGRHRYYVFDCLSELAEKWYSDEMVSNFFMLTCPYLFDIEAIAYFALIRNYHSFPATSAIMKTTQIFLDIYNYKDGIYLYPFKVQHRYSPSMYMLHKWSGDAFPVATESSTISEVLTSVPWFQLPSTNFERGIWNRTFVEAEKTLSLIHGGDYSVGEVKTLTSLLIKMAISRDERMSRLIEKYLSFEDILRIGKRVIGTGLIGGKSVGMLLARSILKRTEPHWQDILEPHDSFYIGSDVFYTFLVRNGIWWERQRPHDSGDYLEGSERARRQILLGTFPQHIEEQFSYVLDYFGQSPFIVRSSSLLEDNFGNAFAGKYESVFCVNQGPRDKRFEDFKTAIKTIYASTMSEKALTYRAQRGLLNRDEQMALLVQRVSGSFYDKLFLPQIAGVGFSFNPYAWSSDIDPKAGVLRLVFGLGTRAVDRNDDDYMRMVALNAPERRPEAGRSEARMYAQKNVDVLDLEANQLVHSPFEQVVQKAPGLPVEMFASRDAELEEAARRQRRQDISPWVLTFEKLLKNTGFPGDMRKMLRTLEDAYDYPVDVEFTCNFHNGDYRINLLQCRPLQVKGGGEVPEAPEVAKSDTILEARGAVIGCSRAEQVDRVVYVVPSVYGELALRERYAVARAIGRLMHAAAFHSGKTIALLGPGRWGTSSPELGIPINFSDINTVSVICEIVEMRDDLTPDVSLGTHLFSELVEMDILYMAAFPEHEDNFINRQFLEKSPNRLLNYLPDGRDVEGVLRVVEADGAVMKINANAVTQKAVLYLEKAE